jgi:tetratricopeptide (TPR) repeat protein
MIDWTDAAGGERAAVIADPAGYQARIAAFRVRRLERQAREALDAGEPFAALARCDRGLAYAADHPGLLALVAEAEAATAAHAPASPAVPTGVATRELRAGRARPITADAAAALAPTQRVPIPATAPNAQAIVSSKWRRWAWLAIAAGGACVGAIAVYLAVPEPAHDPWAPRPGGGVVAPAAPVHHGDRHDRDRELMSEFLSVFGQAVSRLDGAPPEPAGPRPTTAKGWLERSRSQAPADAVASLREALALSPSWLEAQIALCAALAAAEDDGAIGACDAALQRKPGEPALLAARGAALIRAGRAREALADLDRVIKADPDPAWRRLRAHAREAAGDAEGARRDREHACQLGDAQACP